ncbi:MAG: hypothetical protein NTW19_02995 [Planctomycetota bacterium]|nr:hypothetical protein [Planctomycetota bacterium]
MNRKSSMNRSMVAAAAMAGLLAGTSGLAFGATAPTSPSKGDKSFSPAGQQAQVGAYGDKDKDGCNGKDGCKSKSPGTHDCKGKNDCKGKGGCKSGDNGCKGHNSCKGKGGCKTTPAKPADK